MTQVLVTIKSQSPKIHHFHCTAENHLLTLTDYSFLTKVLIVSFRTLSYIAIKMFKNYKSEDIFKMFLKYRCERYVS